MGIEPWTRRIGDQTRSTHAYEYNASNVHIPFTFRILIEQVLLSAVADSCAKILAVVSWLVGKSEWNASVWIVSHFSIKILCRPRWLFELIWTGDLRLLQVECRRCENFYEIASGPMRDCNCLNKLSSFGRHQSLFYRCQLRYVDFFSVGDDKRIFILCVVKVYYLYEIVIEKITWKK